MEGEGGRPNPDELLKRVEAEERKQARGKLKVFLGYSAGVGKTYTMLEESQGQKEKGTDVVVACVESHGRKETEELLAGLESIPLREIDYRGIKVREMDLDAVLARHPQLVLVDELAHTNAPGSRHTKRYQDVHELLDAGIDVYTTLNVQHLDSANDPVQQISGIRVKETIPDSVLDEANEIKIVDLPPKELIQRFKEGKVYVPDRAGVALENFFNEGNLIALREMTLRRAAEHVDEQMLAYMRTRSIPGPWPVVERLLVCIGNSQTLNERVVRTAKRLADELKAEWYAVYIETPAHNRLSRKERQEAIKGIGLASSLGANTSTGFGISIADEVIRFAKKNNVTRIIVGHPVRAGWRERIFGSVPDQIVRASGAIDLIIISEIKPEDKGGRENEERSKPVLNRKPYWYSLWLVLLICILCSFIRTFISPTNVVMLFLIGVVVAAISWGLRPAIFTAAMSVLSFDFFFVPPTMTFRVSDSEYLITFGAFLFVGVVVSFLVARARDFAFAAQRREEYTATMYALSLDLASSREIVDILETVASHVSRSCHCRSAFLLPSDGDLTIAYASEGLNIDEKDMTAANWTLKAGISAGKDTDTLSSALLKYYPLRTVNGVIGVMGIFSEETEGFVKMERERLLQSFASQAAIALERGQLWDQVCKTEQRNKEKKGK
jgi:two-component system, OmpR family, sensor histidine kinase KdpD